MTEQNCPMCGQPPPEELVWNYVRPASGGWEASVRMGRWTGWALQETEEQARQKALARLHYARDWGEK